MRYPAHALAAVALAWLVFLSQLMFGAVGAALLPPMVPAFLVMVLGGASLISSAHAYAKGVARPRSAEAKLPPGRDAEAEANARQVRSPARAA
jgi:xanthine/uracil permease